MLNFWGRKNAFLKIIYFENSTKRQAETKPYIFMTVNQ